MQVNQLQLAGAADARQVAVASKNGDDDPVDADRYSLATDRQVAVPVRLALPVNASLLQRDAQRRRAVSVEQAADLVEEVRRRARRRTALSSA